MPSNLFGALCSSFFINTCSGLWSDSMLTCLPYVYWLNFSTAYTTANISLSICMRVSRLCVCKSNTGKSNSFPVLQQCYSNFLFTCITLYRQLLLEVVELQRGSLLQLFGLIRCFVVGIGPLPFSNFMRQLSERFQNVWQVLVEI